LKSDAIIKTIQFYPLNATGDFGVENGCCMLCSVPVDDVPDMMRFNDDESHCYIYRQPESQPDIDRMVAAANTSEGHCIHYVGKNASILKQMPQLKDKRRLSFFGRLFRKWRPNA
jgi:hypothetical protein